MSALTRFERLDEMFPEFFSRWPRPMQLDMSLPKDIRTPAILL